MTGQLNHLDIFMKMLEVIEKDLDAKPRHISPGDKDKVHTIIEKIEGTLIVNTYEQEVTMSGDTFSHINNSVIAARGAIARGVISVREQRGAEAADAISSLQQALESSDVLADKRAEALELLGEISGKASDKGSSKTILKSLGSSLKGVLDDIGSISSVVDKAWPVIAEFWS
jgi:hypothetical protein